MSVERWRTVIAARFRALCSGGSLDRDLDEELRYHLDRLTEANIARGLRADEARRVARLAMGGIERRKEECRDARGTRLLSDLLQDIRYAFRMLRRAPAFALIAVSSLGLGIAATISVFTVADAVMWRKLAVEDPSRLVTLEQVTNDGHRAYNFSYQDFERFSAGLPSVFSGMYATTWADAYNVQSGGRVDEGLARVSVVTGNFFTMLGVRMQRGRPLAAADDALPGANPVAVISDSYWSKRFGKSDIAGRTLTLNGTTVDIIGVAAPRFVGDWVGWPTDIWIPEAMAAVAFPESAGVQMRGLRRQHKLIARLAPSVSRRQAQAAASALFQTLQAEPPPASGIIKGARLEVASAATGYSRQRETIVQPLTSLMLAAAIVLVIACVNTANLLLARAAARRREMAMRVALGAARVRVLRQLLAEGFVLVGIAGALGLLVATWLTRVMSTLVRSGPVLSVNFGAVGVDLDTSLDSRAIFITIVICLVTSVIFAMAPAAHAARVSLWPALAGHSLPGRLGRGFSVRKSLLVLQVALSVALLIGAALFTRTLANLRTQDLGLTGERLLLVSTFPGQTPREGDDLTVLWKTVRERIAALPGVVSVTASAEGLLVSSPAFVGGPPARIDGAPTTDSVTPDTTATVAPRFFETVGQRLLRGRDFSDADNDTAPSVVILSDSLARRIFAAADPIGRRIALQGNRRAPTFEVVGVVSDRAHTTRARHRSALYYPAGQNTRRLRTLCLAIRTVGDPMSLAPDVRRELHAIDPRLPILNMNSLEDQLNEALALDRLIVDLSVGFATLALVLAAAGVYGTLAYAVARRTREIGVRVALGATRRGVLALVIKEGLMLAAGGIAIGVPSALLAMRQISGRLHGVSAADPLSVIAAVTIMTATVIIASVVPARRASDTDPMTALRCE